MNREFFYLIALALFALTLEVYICDAKVIETRLDEHVKNDFENFPQPDINQVKAKNLSKSIPYVDYEKVWDAIIKVAIQQGVIVRSSKEQGILIVVPKQVAMQKQGLFEKISLFYVGLPPFVVFVERNDPITVYIDFMEDLYLRLDKEENLLKNLNSEKRKEMSETLLDMFATQIYADQKWQYLYQR